MRFNRFLLSLLLLPAAVFAQTEEEGDPVYVVDSVLVTPGAANQITPDQIGLITIAKGRKAVLLYGAQAENGVIYMETKAFARKRVNNFLKSVAPAYDSLRKTGIADSTIAFVVNDQLVGEKNEALLFTVDEKTFRTLELVPAKELEQKYQLTGKKAGVRITSSED
ncbi:hypothetical protein SAMN05444266_11073 [Chitinophaga jiangningensis]|uniref:Uncharacterized protein n=1 Tax=Chitinophaga jiangningensis TaxID=1419482 RepID=A0A1M7L0M1_9BACT|nr:hypothetical protein [Chitinophaga jiangningensis]SHM71044.1 hypothetical protein SAMN05444266_11073 [Chitinophaga jiangningensis]